MDATLQSVIQALPSEPVADILSIGVCPRCVFRFFGLRDAIYLNPAFATFLVECKHTGCNESSGTTKGQEGSTGLEADKKTCEGLCSGGTNNPCIVCLGILHSLDIAAEGMPGKVLQREEKKWFSLSKAQIVGAVKEEGHQFDTFCLEVTLPGVVLVRERALWQYLQEKYGSESCLQGKHVSEHVVSLKEALKWALIEPLEKSLKAVYDTGSAFRIALLYKHLEASNELSFLGCTLAVSTKRKRNGSNEGSGGLAGVAEPTESLAAVQRCLASMSPEVFADLYPCPPSKRSEPCELNVLCHRTSIYVGGRYLKFSRNLSQSRWLIDDERMGDGSVQEIIADIVFPHFKADSYKFHAAGREDIDVRMLGNGRPFMLEFSNARILLTRREIQKLEESINNSKEGWVKVRNLKLVENDAWNLMLEGESEKQKQYTAVIWLSRLVTEAEIQDITDLKDLEIQQRTPVRVLHRRSPLVRPRVIHWMRLERIVGTEQYFLLHLCTQAGTYIKEFVHGDLGRTYPNMGSLFGCEAEILQLDVTDIKMDLFN